MQHRSIAVMYCGPYAFLWQTANFDFAKIQTPEPIGSKLGIHTFSPGPNSVKIRQSGAS